MIFRLESKGCKQFKNNLMNKIVFSLLGLLLFNGLFAQDLPARPEPPTLVNDFAQIIDPGSESALEQKLVDFFAATSTQIAVVTVDDLQGYEPSDYAFRLGEQWGVGNEKFDNGIVILVKPKTNDSRGQVFIAVGYGLEGVVPDATAKKIVENDIIPYFQNGDMIGGIDNATNILISLSKGEYNYQQYAKKGSGGGAGIAPIIILVLVFVVLPAIFGRRRGSFYSAGNKSNLPFWLAMGLLSGAGRKHSGFFDDFSSGSGSFGGFGSGSGNSFGSFGGFGGGSFGGGGAGGSW